MGPGSGSGVAWGGFFIDRVFSRGLIFAFTDGRLLVGAVEFARVLSSGMPLCARLLYARLNDSTEPESSCSTSEADSEHMSLIELCKLPTPVCNMMGILPTWQEGDEESLSRGDGGMIDMRCQ